MRSKFTGIPQDWIVPISQQAAGQRPSPAGALPLPAAGAPALQRRDRARHDSLACAA